MYRVPGPRSSRLLLAQREEAQLLLSTAPVSFLSLHLRAGSSHVTFTSSLLGVQWHHLVRVPATQGENMLARGRV